LPSNIFTFGYAGRSLSRFAAVVGAMDAIVLDIRVMPWSRKYPQWSLPSLVKTFGHLYCPETPGRYLNFKSWGNRNRLCGGEMRVANWAYGLTQFEQLPARPVIILCCCRSQVQCHRGLIARLLREKGYRVRELPWGRQVRVDALLADWNDLVLTG
jgi:uncharacterized protein (DUF488 family)